LSIFSNVSELGVFDFFFIVLRFFAESLERYHSQHKSALSVRNQRPLGMLLVDAMKLKDKLIPNPLRCLEVGATPTKV